MEWFNRVDATYRSELRETNELNWARFEAKLVQGLAELRAEFHMLTSAMETRLIRWMFLFWIGTLGTVIALLKL